MYKANSFENNNKQVIPDNGTASPRLPTNAVSTMQCIFGSNSLLGTTQLALAFKQIRKLKFAFAECKF